MQEPSATVTVDDVMACIEAAYPNGLAEDWDSIGLICGNPSAEVRRILVAVDPVPAVVREAIDGGFDMVVTHHPLFLSGVTSVAANSSRGQVVHALISHGVALANAHTNADRSCPGVSDALAAALGLVDCSPLAPGSNPAEGIGRVGSLPAAMSLGEFADLVCRRLPATQHGVRVAGDPSSQVARVAVCGGSGDSLLGAATLASADVYVTSDLKHHRTQDHLLDGGCAVIDVAHWASEWPWLGDLARVLRAGLPGATVEVSSIVTDPWTAHLRSMP